MLTVNSTFARLEAVEAVTVSGQILAGAKLHLYQNNMSPSPDTLLATFVEADYSGYAAATVGTWGDGFIAPDGSILVQAPDVQFQPTSGSIGNTVYGWYLTNAAGSILLAAAKFDSPVALTDPDHGVVVQPKFVWGA